MRGVLPCAILLLFGAISDANAVYHPSAHGVSQAAAEKRASATTMTPSQLAHLQAVTAKLSTDVSALSAGVDALESAERQKGHEINNLNHENHALRSSISNLTKALNTFQSSVASLDSYVKDKINNMETHLHNIENGIGFTAQFRANSVGPTQIDHHNRWQILKFDLVTQKGGINYNASDGHFKAPSAGTYAFFLTVQRNDPYHDDCVELTVRLRSIDLITVSACSPGYSSSSSMGLVHIGAGQTVYVRTQHSSMIQGGPHTTFSGFKVF